MAIQERNVKGSTEDILDTLDWLGISPHESARAGGKYGPYIQSKRIDLYK
jgi:glutamyl-tRNA synthetase